MSILFKNANVFTQHGIKRQSVLLHDGKLRTNAKIFPHEAEQVIELEGLFMFPGFVDVHVHLREPGFSYKETIRTGTSAAAHGGYTAVCAMPNIKPVPSTLSQLQAEIDLIKRDALIHVYPIGAITMNQTGRGELSRIEEISPYVAAFSDDGKGIQDEDLMRQAMIRISSAGKLITAHCEVESELKPGGCINEGEYSRLHRYTGINNASEYLEVQRDIRLASETGAHLHICHVSTRQSVELIREAKMNGVNVTAETAPHYLIFTDDDLEDNGKWKMNPPIRSIDDRHELLKGIKDGTIDCIITDHAPHSEDEKSKGLGGSAFGIVGLETCFPAMYHNLVLGDPEDRSGNNGAITLERLLEMMCVNPRKIFGLPGPKYIEDDCEADFVIMDLGRKYIVDTDKFLSMGRSTMFDGKEVQGEVVATYLGGRKVYDSCKGILP